jgi:hypothetical protein
VWGTGTPKVGDEVNSREVECVMGECDLETIGLPSTLRVIRSVAPLVRMLPTFDLRTPCDGSGTGHGQITEAEVLKMQKCVSFPMSL